METVTLQTILGRAPSSLAIRGGTTAVSIAFKTNLLTVKIGSNNLITSTGRLARSLDQTRNIITLIKSIKD